MTDSLFSHCMKITNEIINNEPLAIYFINLNTMDKKMDADYRAKIKNPIDFNTVKKKLKDNEYKSFQEWVDDINLIYENAIEFNERSSVTGGIAVYLQKQFHKKLREIEAMNVRNFENQIMLIGQRLESILKQPPPSFNVECKYDLDSLDSQDFDVPRINRIKQELEKFINDGKQNEILECINSSNSEYLYHSGEEIDLAHLGRNTLLALEKLVHIDPYEKKSVEIEKKAEDNKNEVNTTEKPATEETPSA